MPRTPSSSSSARGRTSTGFRTRARRTRRSPVPARARAVRSRAAKPPPPLRGFLHRGRVIAVLGLAVWALRARNRLERGGRRGARRRGRTLLRGGLAHRREAGLHPLRRSQETMSASSSMRTESPSSAATAPISTPKICHDLYRLAFEDEVSGAKTGARTRGPRPRSPGTCAGWGNEGTTECYALQSGVELGVRLGLSEASRAPAHAPAADRAPVPRRRVRRVPRPRGLHRRWPARPQAGRLVVPVTAGSGRHLPVSPSQHPTLTRSAGTGTSRAATPSPRRSAGRFLRRPRPRGPSPHRSPRGGRRR